MRTNHTTKLVWFERRDIASHIALTVPVSLLCFSSALMEGMVTPLQDRMEEWKKTANQLDKDHAKGTFYQFINQRRNALCHRCLADAFN